MGKRKIDEVKGIDLDIISTLIVCFNKGIDVNVIEQDIPNFMVYVELKRLVANTLKGEEEYYEFLDDVNQERMKMEFEGKTNKEVREYYLNEHPAVINFMDSREFLK